MAGLTGLVPIYGRLTLEDEGTQLLIARGGVEVWRSICDEEGCPVSLQEQACRALGNVAVRDSVVEVLVTTRALWQCV